MYNSIEQMPQTTIYQYFKTINTHDMKKVILLGFMAILLSSYVCAQDTVRYGDPWYKFNTMPALKEFSRGEPPSVMNIAGGYDCLQEYYNDNSELLIYGIAYTGSGFYYKYYEAIDKYPQYNPFWKAFLYWGPLDNHVSASAAFAHIDSSLIKFCKYEYEFALPTPHNKVVDCVEVYFDNPVLVQKDTFYAGVNYYLPEIPPYSYETAKDTSRSVRWFFSSVENHRSLLEIGLFSSFRSTAQTWGVCFPIVKLRCTTPRGLQVVQNEAGEYVAQWPADSNAEDYEVAVCYTTQQPANDAVRYIPATGLSSALGHLSPDTTYRIHLRKRCSYTTSGYSDTVASDWSAPVIVAAPTGINAASDRRLHFGIQPNPASGSATVELDGNTEGTLTLTDLFGRTLTTMAVHAGTTTAALDLGGLPAGLYLLQLTTKDAMATRRLSVR